MGGLLVLDYIQIRVPEDAMGVARSLELALARSPHQEIRKLSGPPDLP